MPTAQKKEKTPAQIRFDILLDEMDVKHATFKKEAQIRLEKIDEHIERTKHNVLVTEHDMIEDMRDGAKKIQKAASAILLPEDAL